MLFMTICSYSPENRSKVIERRLQKGAMDAPGTKLLGEWSYTGGGKVFRLVEASDGMQIIASSKSWADLMQIEIHPVVETEQVLKLLSR